MPFPGYLADADTFSHFILAFQVTNPFMRFQLKHEERPFLQKSSYLLHLNIHSILKAPECLEKMNESLKILHTHKNNHNTKHVKC